MEVVTCLSSLVQKTEEYLELTNRIEASTNPAVRALLSEGTTPIVLFT